jgi:hypothetical protein
LKTMEPKSAANYKAIKRKILTNLAAFSLLVGAFSTQGVFRGQDYGGDYGHQYGYSTYGYPMYGFGPSTVGPAYVDNPWGYDFDDAYGSDGWPDYDLPPPAPNPVGPSKTIEIPQDQGK